MFARKKKTKPGKPILRRQKVKRNFSSYKLVKRITTILTVTLCFFTGYKVNKDWQIIKYRVNNVIDAMWSYFDSDTTGDEISERNLSIYMGNEKISIKAKGVQSEILSEIKIGYENCNFNLECLTKVLYRSGNYDRVSFYHSPTLGIKLFLNQRVPMAYIVIDNNSKKFITKNLVVYDSGVQSTYNKKLPHIYGILGKKDHPLGFKKFDPNFLISRDKKDLLMEAKDLIAQSLERGLNLRYIKYLKYRGFEIYLADNKLRVLLGRSPFETSLSRLKVILEKLAVNDKKIEVVDLDYHGKIFIKENM